MYLTGVELALYLVLAAMFGAVVGIFVMALMRVSREDEDDDEW